MNLDRRSFVTEFEVRTGPSGSAIVEGHGAVFNLLSKNLGGFVERVDPKAFKQTLGNDPDVRALINHNPMNILGRTRSGTLRLSTDSTGLAYEIDMPNRQDARDLMASLERGDITQSSFAFYITRDGDEWSETEDGFPLRTITNVSLHDGDVSPVTYPAYPDADSGLRKRAIYSLAAARELDPLMVDLVANEDGGLLKIIRNELRDATPEEIVETAVEEARELPSWFTSSPLIGRSK